MINKPLNINSLTASCFDYLDQGISVTDAEFKLVFCNKQFMEILELPEEMFLSGDTTLEDVFRYNALRGEYGEGNIEDQVKERLDLARLRKAHSFERIRPDGTVIKVVGNPLPDGGFVTTYTDVTDNYNDRHALEIANRLLDERVRQRTEELNNSKQELSDKAMTLEMVMANVTSGLALFDKDHKLSVWNDQFFDMTDFPSYLSIKGTPAREFIQFDVDKYQYGLNATIDTTDKILEHFDTDIHLQFMHHRKNGRIFDIHYLPIAAGVLVSLTDITDQKKAEDFLRRNNEILEEHVQERTAALQTAKEQAENASASKSAFLANMSHELRTPLNAIIGFSELLMMNDYELINKEKRHEYSEGINSAGVHLLQVINDILDVAKIEANQVNLMDQELELHSLLESCKQLVSVAAEKRNLSVTTIMQEGLPYILGDPTRLKQIIVNLLSNAVKFTDPGGEVKIDVGRCDRGGVRISVIDSGIGIAKENIAHVLTQFGQIHSAYNREHQGTGLGLSLVRLLTEAHDGFFKLESELGVGTRAHVHLPAERLCIQQA
ncbi:PAS domain-containing protein [Sneathiella sp. P13V-1]|uniref:PAS domain-containing sensor histidine kinase n=1 Tax=Sneathiella sp. P13V-1 TaxID=2697366 RepID=UPI00187B2077|nr:PAS-domain containing protein [Sneathiella sp. P13V-1]MBE7637692.1 PAS domain-containing protein [Sneathiella sp. P13V-1]